MYYITEQKQAKLINFKASAVMDDVHHPQGSACSSEFGNNTFNMLFPVKVIIDMQAKELNCCYFNCFVMTTYI